MRIDYKAIGARIQAKRKQQRLTQEQLAEALSVSVGYISQIERGIAKANLEMLAGIATQFHCDLTEFLADINSASKEFLAEEYAARFSELNANQKKLILAIMDLLKNQQ